MRLNVDKRSNRIALHVAFGSILLATWYVIGYSHYLFPTPVEVIEAMHVQVLEDGLIEAITDALTVILLGYGLAALVGIPLGMIVGISDTAERVFDPYLTGLYVTPIAALVPALVIWFGIGFTVRLVVVFLFAIFHIVINTVEGTRSIPREFIETAHSFGAGRRFIMKNVVLYHEIPYIMAGLRMGIGRAVKGLVIAELLIAVTGLGGILTDWSIALRMEGVFSVVVILMALGIVLTKLVQLVEAHFVTWDVAQT